MLWNSTFISTAPPEPSGYRRSSLLPISSQDGIRANQTFNCDFPPDRARRGNISHRGDLKSANFEAFSANRSNLNVSFKLADTLAQRKIDSIVQKFERRHPSVATTTTSTTSPTSPSNQSLLVQASVTAASRDHSTTSQRKNSSTSHVEGVSCARDGSASATETRNRNKTVRDESLGENAVDNGYSHDEVPQTVPLSDFQKEVEKLSTLIEEFSLCIQRQNDLEQRYRDKRKEISQNTEKKRKEYLGQVQSNIDLSVKVKSRSDESAQLANHVATLLKAIEESRYSISRLRSADGHLNEMKWVHYKLKKTLDKQKRVISDMDAEISNEMKKPILSGRCDSGMRTQRDNLSRLSAVLYKLEKENQSLNSQLNGIRTMTPTKRHSQSSNFSEGFKPIPRRSSVLSAHSNRPSSRRPSAVSTISSSTMTFK